MRSICVKSSILALTHYAIPILHSIMEDNKLCSLCSNESASVFCICSDFPFVCSTCQPSHQSRPDFHFFLPQEAHRQISPDRQQQVRATFFSLANSIEQMKKGVKRFDQCREEVERVYRDLHSEIDRAKAETLTKLERLKEAASLAVEKAVSELSENAYRVDYQPKSQLAGMMWAHCKKNSSEPISVLTYQVTMQDERLKDPVEVIFESTIMKLAQLKHESGGMQLRRELLHKSQQIERLAEFILTDDGAGLKRLVRLVKEGCKAEAGHETSGSEDSPSEGRLKRLALDLII